MLHKSKLSLIEPEVNKSIQLNVNTNQKCFTNQKEKKSRKIGQVCIERIVQMSAPSSDFS